jgi:hypothetical protein
MKSADWEKETKIKREPGTYIKKSREIEKEREQRKKGVEERN